MTVSWTKAGEWMGRNDQEDGLDALRLHHLVSPDATRGLIGFACDAGVARNKGKIGAHEAPDAIRKAMTNLSAPNDFKNFSDLGDIKVAGDSLEDGQAELANHISDALQSHERVVVLGGGHETAFASYCSLVQRWPDKRIGIINLDAHLDLRAVGAQGPSSGTPFFQIRELRPDEFDYLCLGIAEEANTSALMKLAERWNVNVVSDKELLIGFTSAENQIAALFDRNDIIYLTIDMDVLPHYVAPGVSAPATRGVPFQTIEHLIDFILRQSAEGVAMLPLSDIVEVCPRLDQQGVTARTAAYLARKLLMG